MNSRLAVVLSGALLLSSSALGEQGATKILIPGDHGTTTLTLPTAWDPCPECNNVDIWSFYATRTLRMKIDPIPMKNMAHRRVQEEFTWFDLHPVSTPEVVVELTAHAKAGKDLSLALSKNVDGMNADFHQGATPDPAEDSPGKGKVVAAVATREAPWSDVKLDCHPARCLGKQQAVSPDEKGHEVIGIVLLDPGPKSDVYFSFVVYSSKDDRQLPLDLISDLARSIRTTSH